MERNAGFELNQLREADCEYPEYQFLEACVDLDGKDDVAKKNPQEFFTVKNLQEKNWKQPELISISVQ